jgi:hypothetical protein
MQVADIEADIYPHTLGAPARVGGLWGYRTTWLKVQWGFHGKSAALENVGVDHGGFDVFVSQ